MTNPPTPPLMTSEQLAQRLNVSVRFVRRLVEQQRVPYVKIGKFVRFNPEQIERWIGTAQPSEARSGSGGGQGSSPHRPRAGNGQLPSGQR